MGEHVDLTGEGDEQITVGVDGRGGDATLTLFDENGTEVGTYRVGAVGGGRQEIDVGRFTEELTPGRYRYQLEVTDADGESVDVQTFTRTRVDGVRYGTEGPVLVSGALSIPLANVVEIFAR